MTTVENKTRDVSNLVKKIHYDAKLADIEKKYITTADYNKFNNDIVAERVKKKDFLKILMLLIW